MWNWIAIKLFGWVFREQSKAYLECRHQLEVAASACSEQQSRLDALEVLADRVQSYVNIGCDGTYLRMKRALEAYRKNHGG